MPEQLLTPECLSKAEAGPSHGCDVHLASRHLPHPVAVVPVAAGGFTTVNAQLKKLP